MKINTLGNTGIKVSRMCFGSLTIGPLQKNKTLLESREIIAAALDCGVNFFDTADLYNNYDHLRAAIAMQQDVVVATKSYDYTAAGVRSSLNRALTELDRDYVDLYLLHEQESQKTIEGHWEAIEALIAEKKAGKVRAIGISTHRVEGVYGANRFPELDVIHPLINLTGIGIEDGTAQEMVVAIHEAKKLGKGIYGMKPLGGGNLLSRKQASFEFVLNNADLDAIAIGVQSVNEVLYNVKIFNGEKISEDLETAVSSAEKTLHISDWCTGCGECVRRCNQKALAVVVGKAQVDEKKCVLCCYCSTACKDFCIKVI
ncbi:aldo/keto reductase [Acetobacterium sp.]|jgi:aryl-alcohol dehydrogenase-like predicted oxidoreductase|uniref:aldo/keto reductase n=1 Tax=Acetobacterium sp. TaxID=1872094 RepID=UPI00271FC8C0|nr:aldo/keto reductase [Acetobacterium sp.]MDO9492067.1 aldo/keto reductase [Acetobacterium sp.]